MSEPRWLRIVRWVVLGGLTIFTLGPLYVMVSSALKPLREVQGAFHWVPSTVTLRPFADIWKTIPLGRYFLNSLIVSTSATLVSVTLAVFAAYSISRFRFPGRRIFSVTVL